MRVSVSVRTVCVAHDVSRRRAILYLDTCTSNDGALKRTAHCEDRPSSTCAHRVGSTGASVPCLSHGRMNKCNSSLLRAHSSSDVLTRACEVIARGKTESCKEGSKNAKRVKQEIERAGNGFSSFVSAPWAIGLKVMTRMRQIILCGLKY